MLAARMPNQLRHPDGMSTVRGRLDHERQAFQCAHDDCVTDVCAGLRGRLPELAVDVNLRRWMERRGDLGAHTVHCIGTRVRPPGPRGAPAPGHWSDCGGEGY